MKLRRLTLLALAIGSCVASTASAIVVYGKSTRNKDAPGGLIETGWEYTATYGAFTAYPIGKKYFITAAHPGNDLTTPLVFQGKTYTSTNYWDDPNSDLRLYRVSGKFNAWAPLFDASASTEVGETTVVMGRGTTRSAPVYQNGELKGWRWGRQDGVLSWGVNQIDSVYDAGTNGGQFLTIDFDSDQGKNEGMLTRGDSGGGMFVKQNKKWRLAGINYSVEGPFSLSSDTSQAFMGAFTDTGGLYSSNGSLIPDTGNTPGKAYATRIAGNQAWINAVLSGTVSPNASAPGATPLGIGQVTPEPGTLGVLVIASMAALRRRSRRACSTS